MALLFMESFDGYGGTVAHMDRKYIQGPASLSSTCRTGTHSMVSAGRVIRAIAPATKTLIVQGALYYTGVAAEVFGSALSGDAVNASQWSVQVTSGQKVLVARNNGLLYVLETSAICLTLNQWNSIEAKILCNNSGTYVVKVNGVEVLNGSGDTQQQSSDTIGSVWFGSGASQNLDDVVVMDSSGSQLNDFIGDRRVGCVFPNGDGANTGLSCSTGSSHFALVDETPANDDTDYVYGATVALKDTFTFPDATSATIDAVQLTMTVRKTDTGAKTVCGVARSGGTDYDGATQAVGSTSYTQLQQIWETDPDTSAAWTVSGVNAAEFGVKIVA